MTSPPKHKTICRFCKQEFSASALGMPVPGEQPPPRLIKFVMALGEHLNDNHQDEMDGLSGRIQDFSGLLILNSFESEDPGLNARLNAIRADIHSKTQRHFITDANVTDLVARIGLDPEHERAVFTLMREMRDAYEEKGDWSPAKQAEKHAMLV